MKGQKTDVATDFETERHKQNSKLSSDVTYHGEKAKRKEQEAHRPDAEIVKKAPPTTTTGENHYKNQTINFRYTMLIFHLCFSLTIYY